jgi:hypothetical protein
VAKRFACDAKILAQHGTPVGAEVAALDQIAGLVVAPHLARQAPVLAQHGRAAGIGMIQASDVAGLIAGDRRAREQLIVGGRAAAGIAPFDGNELALRIVDTPQLRDAGLFDQNLSALVDVADRNDLPIRIVRVDAAVSAERITQAGAAADRLEHTLLQQATLVEAQPVLTDAGAAAAVARQGGAERAPFRRLAIRHAQVLVEARDRFAAVRRELELDAAHLHAGPIEHNH